MTELIKQSEQRATIEKTHSPYNSPVWPFKKPDRIWHMTIDYMALNKATGPLTALVPSTVGMNMLFSHMWVGVLAMKGMVFMIPTQKQDKAQFAFTWGGRQYTFYCLPQVFKHSPTIAHAMLAEQLESVILPPEVTILQYTDDTLIGGRDEETVHQSMNAIVQYLQELNISVPDLKRQGSRSKHC